MTILEKINGKFEIDKCTSRILSPRQRKKSPEFNILSFKETVERIIETQCSVSRYGDGELMMAAYGSSLRFQRADKKLQARLNEILINPCEGLMLCLPNRLNQASLKESEHLPEFWKQSFREHYYAWTRKIDKNIVYGDTNITRLIPDYGLSNTEMITMLKEIWSQRNVVIVEGASTRMGIGNDLLDNVTEVTRILGPTESAFDRYDDLLHHTKETIKNKKNPLVLVALGPTATVLAADLCAAGCQAIDLGHLDISYEYSLTNQSRTTPIKGKYTNEVVGGDGVEVCEDEDYNIQIAARIY